MSEALSASEADPLMLPGGAAGPKPRLAEPLSHTSYGKCQKPIQEDQDAVGVAHQHALNS